MGLEIIIGIMLGFFGMIGAIVVMMYRTKIPEHDTIVLSFFHQEYSGDSLIHGLEEVDTVFRKGIGYLEKLVCMAKDLPGLSKFKNEGRPTEILVKKSDMYDFSRGTLSRGKNIILLLPHDAREWNEKLKGTPIGRILLEQQFRVDTLAGFVNFMQEVNPELTKHVKSDYMGTFQTKEAVRMKEFFETLKHKEDEKIDDKKKK